MAKYLALSLCLLCRGDPCGSDDCDSLGLFQQRIHGSHKLQREGGLAPPSGPNAEVQATYAALTFALNESTDFVKDKLTQSPLIPKQAVSLGLGINMEIDHVMALNRPDLVFFDPVWTEAGLQVDVDIHNLHASGLLDVTAPQSKGHLNLTGGGHFRVSLSTAVSDGRLAVTRRPSGLHPFTHYFFRPGISSESKPFPIFFGQATRIKHSMFGFPVNRLPFKVNRDHRCLVSS